MRFFSDKYGNAEKRKEEKEMKKRTLLIAILCALSLTLTGCKDNGASSGTQSTVTSTTQGSSDESPAGNGVWDSAKYTEDTELGEGSLAVKIEVTADNRTVALTVKTDETNLEKILVANSLVEGDESEFGLYIKSVNGIRADYDLDHAYWAIQKDGAPTPTGANGITIADGETYALVYTAA